MKIQYKILFILSALMVLSGSLSSQDLIILKDGNSIEGKMLKYVIGSYVVVQTEGDTQVQIPTKSIKSILDDGALLYGKTKKVKQLKERSPLPIDKWYFSWENKLYPNNTDSGLGISLSYLYQWKHYLAAGVGVGYDNYNFSRIRGFVPVFIQARSYVKDAYKSPFIDVKVGYGMVGNKSEQVISNTGGLYNQTSVGLRFGSGGFKTTVSLGIQVQNNELEAFHPWNGGIVTEDRQYRRFVLNLGFLF